ncbi:mycothiol synthase [Georgenia wangjunii]|uniref:mycothiol synthase n=1 Tax=Georgenia wangjunii TaxID=3117730 RepID=UPI002F260D62
MADVSTGLAGPAAPDRVLALLATAEDADGVSPVSEQGVLAVRRQAAGVRHLWVADGTDLHGYAQVDDAGSAELVVHPGHRRLGTGRALLDSLPDDVAVWAHGDLPGAQGLARSAGMRVTRELWRMARPLAGVAAAAPEPPAGVGVRTFEPGRDEEAWVSLNARAFADHPEQGRLGVADLRARMDEPWFDPSLLWFAHEAGSPDTLLASMWVKVVPGEEAGEIYALGVDPAAQGRGTGRWLTALALAELAARGLDRVDLYVDGDNTAAVRTYQRAGFDRVTLDVQYRR